MTTDDGSILKFSTEAEVLNGNASDVVFTMGSFVECRTVLATTYSGQVLCYDPPTRILIIRDVSEVKPIMRFINLAFIEKVFCSKERPSDFVPYASQMPTVEQLKERINRSEALKRISIMQEHVSIEGQHAFISLRKTLDDVRWQGACICVLGRILVQPPYTADSVEATVETTSAYSLRAKEHVRKILQKHKKTQQTPSSPKNDIRENESVSG